MEFNGMESLTKHEQILQHIESLKPGIRISVRQIAKFMDVSEGTAYRALKEAENQGMVTTKERIGTVRVDRKQRQQAIQLSFAEVVSIVEGKVLGGVSGLHKTLHKFVIGAMEKDAMTNYIEAGCLFIVGNRDEVHQYALDQGAGVLITGGFDAQSHVKQLANQLELPIISSRYDTFTVASMINRAIFDRVIKKNLSVVEDVIVAPDQAYVLQSIQTVKAWKELVARTGYRSFPVVDEYNRIVGIMEPKENDQLRDDHAVEQWMKRQPQTVTLMTSVVSAAHTMAWEGYEFLPVTDYAKKFLGVIYRTDVMKAMKYIQKQSQNGQTFETLIGSHIEEKRNDDGSLTFKGIISPQLTNPLGSMSEGILIVCITQVAQRIAKDYKFGDLAIDHISTYFSKPLEMDSDFEIHGKVIEKSRKYCKIEIEVKHEEAIIAKAILMAHLMESI